MNSIKKVISIFLVLIFCLNISSQGVASVNNKYLSQAETLKSLGLFIGTNKGFELEKTSTRAEAAVMLVRLLGAENDAIKIGTNKLHPFTDVPTWANPYVSYLYDNGLTYGISEKLFGTSKEITGNEYTTMILRALGYEDNSGLYKWNTSMNYSLEVGLIAQDEAEEFLKLQNSSLIRDYLVKLSYNSLFTKMIDGKISLGTFLLEKKAFSNEQLLSASNADKELAKLLPKEEEFRGVWISYLDMLDLFKNKTEYEFTTAIEIMFNNVKNSGLNTVLVQVRPFGDAIYQSKYFPWSYIISGQEGIAPLYDPLEIMVNKAHELNLKIEAWINPYRIRTSGSKVEISNSNKASIWLYDNSRRVLEIDEGIYYNPASNDVKKLIVDGVIEIIDNYSIDGIHFDDYFYPTTDSNFDIIEYENYLNLGGNLSLENWRRENVNDLISKVYKAIKDKSPNVKFGISPEGSISNNYNRQYSDVSLWVSEEGYIDYICPQIYYGYNNSTMPYLKTLSDWSNLVRNNSVKLYVGLAAYKLGREDRWAGEGKMEWIESSNILINMINDARSKNNYGGFILFRYDYIYDVGADFEDIVNAEMNAIKNSIE